MSIPIYTVSSVSYIFFIVLSQIFTKIICIKKGVHHVPVLKLWETCISQQKILNIFQVYGNICLLQCFVLGCYFWLKYCQKNRLTFYIFFFTIKYIWFALQKILHIWSLGWNQSMKAKIWIQVWTTKNTKEFQKFQ